MTSSLPSGGNYWDDYTGIDTYGDGIGDTPYQIPSGSNKDNYPLMRLYFGPFADFIYTPTNPKNTTVIHFTDTSYDLNGMIITRLWDFCDGYYSNLNDPIHCYYTDGDYDVTLSVTDDDGLIDTIQKTMIISTLNSPPSKPSIPVGPTKGLINVMHIFTSDASDLDGNLVYYKWDWGDGSISDWIGPYGSDLLAGASHAWVDKGIYYIRVKAKDIYGAESDWSEPLIIKILKL